MGFALRCDPAVRLLVSTTENPGSPSTSIRADDGLGRETPTTLLLDTSTLMPIGRWPNDRTVLARIGSAGLPGTGGGDIRSASLYADLGALRIPVTSTKPPSSLELSSLLISTISAAGAGALWRENSPIEAESRDLLAEKGLFRDGSEPARGALSCRSITADLIPFGLAEEVEDEASVRNVVVD